MRLCVWGLWVGELCSGLNGRSGLREVWIRSAVGSLGISCLLPVRVMTSSENLASGRPPVYRRARAYRLKPTFQREPTASTTPPCVSGSLPPRRADSDLLIFLLESYFIPVCFSAARPFLSTSLKLPRCFLLPPFLPFSITLPLSMPLLIPIRTCGVHWFKF